MEAENKYENAVKAILLKAESDAAARKNLSKLNLSFQDRLREIRPKIQAVTPSAAVTITERIELIGNKLNPTLEITVLDARQELKALREKTDASQMSGEEPDDRTKPSGTLECREDGKDVEIGETFEIEGKTRNIPDGHVIRIFGVPPFGGMFPLEDRKDNNRRFSLSVSASEAWLGKVGFYLMSVPGPLMEEIDSYIRARREWAANGFPEASTPRFRGNRIPNLYLSTLEAAGATKLSEIKVGYRRP